jgi:hypothetical protein
MNFNHLLTEKFIKRACRGKNTNECYWQPAGAGRSTQGNNVHVPLFCKRCGAREELFLSADEYHTQEKLIQLEVGNV